MNIENIVEIESNNDNKSYSKVSVRIDKKYSEMLNTIAKLSNKPINRYLTDYISKQIIAWMINDNQEELKIILEEIDKKYEGKAYGKKGFIMSKENIDACKYSETLYSPIADLSMQWEKDTQKGFIKELKDQFDFKYKPKILEYAENKAEQLPSFEDNI